MYTKNHHQRTAIRQYHIISTPIRRFSFQSLAPDVIHLCSTIRGTLFISSNSISHRSSHRSKIKWNSHHQRHLDHNQNQHVVIVPTQMDPNPDFQRRRNPERNAAGGGTSSPFFSLNYTSLIIIICTLIQRQRRT